MKKLLIGFAITLLVTSLASANPSNKIFLKFNYSMGFAEESKVLSWGETIYYEDASFGANYKAKKGNSFDFGIGYKFSKSVGLELGMDIASRNVDANFNASIPHPILINAPRSAQGTGGYKLTENAVYLNAVFSFPFSKFSVDLFGGPAYFLASCELINAIQYSDPYPHTTISVTANSETLKKNVFGFNAGASLNFYVANNIGIFVSSQYFSGSAEFKPSSGIPGLKFALGGAKAGAGIKILF